MQAGVIVLANGDSVSGQLVRLDGEQLVWKTANFGEQSIKRTNIKSITTDQKLKINGSTQACRLVAMESDYLSYTCGDDAQIIRVPFLTLKVIQPFEDYKKDALIHHGKINLWGAYSRGNEVRDEWNLQAEADLRLGEFRHVLGGEYARSSWFYSVPQTRWNARYSLDWFLQERWFWYNNTVIGADPRRGLDEYVLLGSGAGYQFWENKKTALSLKTGVAYLNEKYLPPNKNTQDFVHGDEFYAIRLGMDFRYTFPMGVSFFHNNELIHSLENTADWRLKTASGISSMILNKVFAEFKFDYLVDNEPQPGREGEDTRLSLGVSYKW
ncbi:hypothetical protein GCM10011613_03260 [Cellvibrio zantedeschiae]|uniref:DUF481 domain-containing protein n=1 Tax=Cellvibrio zantedeschiae TaxID=1237077 RepID=A0ABQ3ANK1_9GAMM|nr:hypothetical protein GCM10011613_03260 [Cellvibrio zantedeschiae]